MAFIIVCFKLIFRRHYFYGIAAFPYLGITANR